VNPSDFERLTIGDPASFADVYDRYARLIRSICFDTTRDLAHAEDLTQDVFLRAYRRIGQLRRPERLASWLAAIARNACRDWSRQRGRDRHQYCDAVPEVQSNETRDADPAEIDALRMAICELPQKERLALHIHYLCEEPAEVAQEMLGMSSSGFYRLIDRARRRLAALLKPLGVEP
jgi:RNA polymerase sigma-70 factor (ECF subfamily)